MSDAIQTDLNALARAERKNGRSWDIVLLALRKAGATPMQCIQALRTEGPMSLSEAKSLLNGSSAWADEREVFESIQEGLGRAFGGADE